MGRDKISKEKRSHIMSCIRSKNTKVELLLRKALWKKMIRYRLHGKLPGKPDLVFKSRKLVVFIDGDFWHGYDFKNLKNKLKNDFWINKIVRNINRDKEVNSKLQEKGWKVIRIWEHKIREDLNKVANKIVGELNNV